MDEDKNKAGNQQVEKTGGYGKRPWWQWLLVYLVVGGLVYWVIYVVAITDDNGGGLY